MNKLAWIAALLMAGPLMAESELEPSLGIVFPLELADGKVTCGEDILLNRNTYLPKGTILLTAFIPPKPDDKDVKRKNAKVDLEKTYSRKKPDVTNSRDNDLERAMLSVARERALRIVWDDPDIFRGWLHKQSHQDYYLVYQMDAESEPRYAQVEFLDGMFLVGREGKATIAGVVPGSRAAEGGLKAGDQIISLNGKAFDQHLRDFFKVYLLLDRQMGKESKAMQMRVINSESGEEREVSLASPYSLHTNPFE